MACKRSAVRSRLPPPLSRKHNCSSGNIGRQYGQFMSPSSRGLGHHPFTVSTGVRIPVGTPVLPPLHASDGGFFIAESTVVRNFVGIKARFHLIAAKRWNAQVNPQNFALLGQLHTFNNLHQRMVFVRVLDFRNFLDAVPMRRPGHD